MRTFILCLGIFVLGAPGLAQARLPRGVQVQLNRSSTGHLFGAYNGQSLGGHLIYGVANERAVARAIGGRVSPKAIQFVRVQTNPTRCSPELKRYIDVATRKLDRFANHERQKAERIGLRYAMDFGYILAHNELVGLFRQGMTGRVMVVGKDVSRPTLLTRR